MSTKMKKIKLSPYGQLVTALIVLAPLLIVTTIAIVTKQTLIMCICFGLMVLDLIAIAVIASGDYHEK